MSFSREDYPRTTGGLTCPITGQELMCTGHDEGVMDGSTYYAPKYNYDKLKYERHPFSWKLFREEKTKRYFILNEDNSWTEYKKFDGVNGIFPIDTPPEEIREEKERQEENERIRKAEWDALSDEEKEARTIPFKQVFAKGLSFQDLIEVKPMGPPIGKLFYLDYVYECNNNS